MSLYNLKTDTGAESYGVSQFIVTKFDDDLNVEGSYLVSAQGCTCPAGHRPSCRHRQMLPMLETCANSSWFLDFDTRQWVDPTGEAASAASSAGQMQIIDDVGPVDWDKALSKGPQGSLGRTTRMEVDPKTIEDRNRLHIYEDSPTADLPLRQVQEESHTYGQVTKLPDSHPFRRRM